ncbi:HAMP domain-containing sensor histidine kinase [Nocardioides sp.]|uniref:sensor histidine kinase n=1 Tax=Nocardioides sp. TaxID=35761 RepID=UPI0025D42F9A|nr:HAMP domain-containing sensor histidine kinase [Nocardioides sp.]
MTDSRVPWRRSLLVRLFGVGALIALVAVVAATWATVRATTVAVREEQQDSLHTDARIYDELVGYAATHPSWADAEGLVDRLALEADRQVSVTNRSGRVLVDSAGERGRRDPARARATLDALAVDPVLLAPPDEELAPVDTGPSPVTCVRGESCRTWVVEPPGVVDRRVPEAPELPGLVAEQVPTRARVPVWERVDACLERAGLGPVSKPALGFAVVVDYPRGHAQVARCAAHARRAWYADRVAPPALLFVSGEGSSAEVFWDLDRGDQVRIALLAGGVLLVTLVLCLALASSVVRPLRRMAAAAHLAGDGDLSVRVPHRRRDEVGEVARAFNRMADRRQQLEEARRRMVSDVSHELRTPLANVRGWLEAAQDGIVEPDGRLLDSLHEETLQLQRLVDDLHDLARGDAGELRLEPTRIDVATFLDQVAESFRGAAESAGVQLHVEASGAGEVRADAVRLRQAVANLVANAVRHTPPGGRVTLRGIPGRVEVTDTGEGIPAADLPHVFERFRRADASRSRATGGSGLGLAIVRQIVEAHGGTVGVESVVGTGTTVWLQLPADTGS